MDSNAGEEWKVAAAEALAGAVQNMGAQASNPPAGIVGGGVESSERQPPARIMVIIPFHNRKRVAELCVPTIAETLTAKDYLVCCNDGSTEYGPEFLEKWADKVCNTVTPVGIEMQRRSHFALYWQYQYAYTHLYLTDSDAIHDPNWRSHALALQVRAHGAPVCLYNTAAHMEPKLIGNTIATDTENGIIWRRVAPGISYLLTLRHVERVMRALHALDNWDWMVPGLLGHRMAVSTHSYVDHVGWGGMHHPGVEGVEGGDRALFPTDFLIHKRHEIVEALK